MSSRASHAADQEPSAQPTAFESGRGARSNDDRLNGDRLKPPRATTTSMDDVFRRRIRLISAKTSDT
jgi:hypothetical protein